MSRNRKIKVNNPNDKIYTPEPVAKDIINKYKEYLCGKVLDPFKGTGAFYDNLPNTVEKDYCELDLGKDFFEYSEHVDWIISNPPYSLFGEVMTHSYEIADNIVYLIPMNKLTSSVPRMRELYEYGGIRHMYLLTPKECHFPFGFVLAAVWIQRNYRGNTTIEYSDDLKGENIIWHVQKN